jgi:hypothetical protein
VEDSAADNVVIAEQEPAHAGGLEG